MIAIGESAGSVAPEVVREVGAPCNNAVPEPSEDEAVPRDSTPSEEERGCYSTVSFRFRAAMVKLLTNAEIVRQTQLLVGLEAGKTHCEDQPTLLVLH